MIRKTADVPNPQPPPSRSAPADAAALLAREVGRGRVVAEAVFDLDADLRYAEGRVALIEDDAGGGEEVVYVTGDGVIDRVAVGDLEKAEIDEAVGLDRLVLTRRDGGKIGLAFSRRRRLGMARLAQRLRRRVGGDGAPDLSIPDRDEAEDDTEAAARPKVLLRLLGVAAPYRSRVWWALFFTVTSSVLTVAPTFVTKYIIDESVNPQTAGHLEVSERVSNLIFWCSIFAGAIVLQLGSFWARLQMLSYVGSRVAGDLRQQVYSHMHALSMRYFGKHRVGSLITRVTSDTDRLWDFIVFGSVDFIKNVLMMAVAAGLMFYVNWRLALIALAPVPLVVVVTWWKTAKMTAMFSRLWTYWSRLTGIVGDALPGVKVVKAFAGEGREVERFGVRNRAFTEDEYKTISVWVSLQPVVEGTMFISRVLILLGGGYLIIRATGNPGVGHTGDTLGSLFMFMGIVGFFHMAIADLAMKQRMVARAATSAQRVFEVLDTPVEITSKPGAVVPDRLDGRIEFRNVSFSYDGTKPVLRHVSLVAEPGQMIGLCGHSGAGKSTFVNLISRFYDVGDGQILLDGRDVRDLDLAWLRSHVGVVLQDPYLFHGTIADNVRYGRPDASLADVIAAARAANAHDFITNLPDGYDTMVGERGQSLSGGERQRVSIARAILHNPKILVLDEATSSVDTKTERQIQQALDHLVQGRTVFAIAHRLSTLRDADRIVVLDKGSVTESGTHDELLAREDGAYRKLYKVQSEAAADMLAEV